jgi:ribosomal protein S12 methylthiotransferase
MARKTIALVSLGCAKNAVDLQVMSGNLLKKGWTLSSDPDRADMVIVNTCSFIESAREEAEAEILRAVELKRRGNYGKVVVVGCYPQRYPELKGAFPGVDEWGGVPQDWIEPRMPTLRFTGKAFAYLKIAEGCAHRCAYCAIPLIRGKYRSRPMSSILKEARALVASGCRELDVVAQDPMLWCEKGKRLPDLLRAIDGIPGDFWVRVLYSYPSEISEEFLVWMLTSPHAVRYVDVPLQHTVPEVLAKMNRRAAIDDSLTAAEFLRDVVPDVTLRTTIMTGFPGETEARFRVMMSDLRRMQFDHLGCFAYSPEKGTKGAKLAGRPSRTVAEKREMEVMDLAKSIWKTRSKRLVGKVFRALVVAPGVARMESQAPDVDGVTYLASEGEMPEVGEFVDVKILKVKGFDFIGEVVG